MRKITFVLMSCLMFGCGSIAMQDEQYEYFSGLGAWVQKCHETGYIDSTLYENAKAAWGYSVGTWLYDQKKLSTLYDKKYAGFYPTTNDCNQAKSFAYDMISGARKHHANSQAIAETNARLAQQNAALLQQINQNSAAIQQQVNQPISFGFDSSTESKSGAEFYYPSDCIGPVVGVGSNGQCLGTINPSARAKICHGVIVNGECKGTVTSK